MKIRRCIYKLLTGNKAGKLLFYRFRNLFFPGSAAYWEKRYARNGNSGVGSYDDHAVYKADFINRFVAAHGIRRVVELGCGDGNQLKYLRFDNYLGADVSVTALQKCKHLFEHDSSKTFCSYDSKFYQRAIDYKAELSLSLDVIYHLVEDTVFEKYMYDLFALSSRYVIVYAWDANENQTYHVRHRNFSKWINDHIVGYQLKERITQSPFCDFFIYEKISDA